MNSLCQSMLYAAEAMSVHSWGMAVTAHNLANVNTPVFFPQKTFLTTGAGGRGVRLETVTGGPLSKSDLNGSAVPREKYGNFPRELPSGTDPATEFAGMIATQSAFEANSVVVSVMDSLYSALLDLSV